jgi:hypothetical protein
MNNAAVSGSFTIDDIRKIRDANYEHTKDMTYKEIIEHTRKEAYYGLCFLQALKKQEKINNP